MDIQQDCNLPTVFFNDINDYSPAQKSIGNK